LTFTKQSHKVKIMNTTNIKQHFAIFAKNPTLIYLDAAATSLTPCSVVEKISSYYTDFDANIARGTYKTSAYATEQYEVSRKMIADFISAKDEEIVFTSGTTASINTIAHGLTNMIAPGDTIVTTKAEHHANFVPWQILAKNTDATFIAIDPTTEGQIDQAFLLNAITPTTKIVALSHVSNVLGTINPLKEIIQKIRKKNPTTLIIVDAAQSIAHIPIDVRDLDCDFLAFSLHKLFGPTGVGVLYGKKEKLATLTPLFTGGEMIENVSSTCTTFREAPHRLEAGTPHIAGVIAVQEAINFVQKIGLENIHAHEMILTEYLIDCLTKNFGSNVTIFGPKNTTHRSSIVSFTFKDHHPHDISSILDNKKNIAIRAGQHCAMPLHTEVLHTNATARISLSIYNTKDDIIALIDGLRIVNKTLTNGKL
jgi:cysteine desulfurase / selenocysteine lyase